MNWLERIKRTISIDDAKKAANDHKEAVKCFVFDMRKERAFINSKVFSDEMKRQMEKHF